MSFKRIPFIAALLLPVLFVRSAPLPAPPRARSAPITGAIVVHVRYDAEKNETIATVANVSHKGVTAFGLGVYFADGRYLELDREFLGTVDLFHPGTTVDVVFAYKKEDAKVVVGAVVYANDTAEVVDERAFKSIIKNRVENALAYERANELLAGSTDAEAVAKQLESEAVLERERNTDDPMPSQGTLNELALEIRRTQDFDALKKKNEERAAVWRSHANPVVEGKRP
jgi:hypothetical protein